MPNFNGRFVSKNFVADMVRLEDNSVGLLTFNGEKQELVPTPVISVNGTEYRANPINTGQALCLPTEKGVARSASDLLKDIKSQIKKVVKLHREEQYTLLSVFILSTWVYRMYSNVVYVIFTGNAGTGKSSAQNACHYLCYNSLRVAGSSTNPSLIRSINSIQGTLCIDEVQVFASDMRSEAHAILAVGFSSENGIFTKTRQLRDGNWVVDQFDVFCPKILSGRTHFTDEAIVSRCLEFKMHPYQIKEIPTEKPTDKKWQDQAAKLRNDLLFWSQRRSLGLEPTSGLDYRYYAEQLQLSPREFQVCEILLDVCPNKEILLDVLKCIETQKREISEWRKDLFEPNVLITLHELKRKDPQNPVYLSNVAFSVGNFMGERVSARRIGFILNANGLKKLRRNDGTVCTSPLEEIEQAINGLGIPLGESPSLSSLLHSDSEKSDEGEDESADTNSTGNQDVPERPSFRTRKKSGGVQ